MGCTGYTIKLIINHLLAGFRPLPFQKAHAFLASEPEAVLTGPCAQITWMEGQPEETFEGWEKTNVQIVDGSLYYSQWIEIRRPAGVSDWKVLFLCCSWLLSLFLLFPRVFASSESRSPPLPPLSHISLQLARS